VARLLDPIVDLIGRALAMVMHEMLDVSPGALTALLEVDQLAACLLRVGECRRHADQLFGGQEQRASRNEDRSLEELVRTGRAAPIRGLRKIVHSVAPYLQF
jgi:hypothetical protein